MTTTTPPAAAHTAGRGWAYTGALLGGIVSVAANIAHTFIPPHGAPEGWRPAPGAIAASIVWPVFLFIAIEILARTPWPLGTRWGLARYGGILPVAAIAAIVSYRHLSGLLAHYGEEPLVYHLGPLAVDGLMVMATAALLATTGRHRPPTEEPATRPGTEPNPHQTAGTAIVPARLLDPVPTQLLGPARFAANHHHTTTGQPITAGDLALRLSIPTETATRLLRELHGDATSHLNGHPVEAVHR